MVEFQSVFLSTQVTINEGVIIAKGKLGELSFEFKNDAKVQVSENSVLLSKKAVILVIIVKCGELLGPELII